MEASELQQGGIETNRLPLAFQYSAFQIIVQYDPGKTTPGVECPDMAT